MLGFREVRQAGSYVSHSTVPVCRATLVE